MFIIRVRNGKHREVKWETTEPGFEPRQADDRPLCEDEVHSLAFANITGSSVIRVVCMSGSGCGLAIFSPDCQAAKKITFQMSRCGQLTGHPLAFI